MNKVVDGLVVIATFLETNQAHVVRLRLEAEGIQVILEDEHHIAMNWFVSNAIGGVKLLVPERQLETAKCILQNDAPEIPDDIVGDETDVEASITRCPSCNSGDTYPERLKRRMVFLSILLLGIPLPFISHKMICENCGHRWSAR